MPTTCTASTQESAVVNSIVADVNTKRDFGTQCCFGYKYTCTTTVETQTDIFTSLHVHVETADVSVQADPESFLDKMNVQSDHCYALPATPYPYTSPMKVLLPAAVHTSSTQEYLCSDDNGDDDDDEGEEKEEQEQEEEQEEEEEEEYVCSSQEFQSSTTDTDSAMGTQEQTYETETKYLVFSSCLKKLFTKCPSCGDVVSERRFTTTGSLLTVKLTCVQGHDSLWNSQPMIKQSPVGNLLIASSILFTGNTFGSIQSFSSCLGLEIISERVFYSIQDRYLFPVINHTWQEEQRQVIESICSKDIVYLSGDGRCDSPGHNAKYGTYTLMDNDSGKVAAFSLVQVSEVTSSNAMEKEGFERCLKSLQDANVCIACIATDRHVSISSTMDKNHSEIKHQYDVWHFSKSIVKKLTNKAKLKQCQDLAPWIQSVSNHLWWCCATCDGDVQILRERWLSMLHHITNKHSWHEADVYHECSHPVLTRRQVRKTCWLKPGSPSFVALEDVVTNPRILKDMAKLTEFCHTGSLEVYHSMMLKYSPKREHFSYKGMMARTQLAAIDNNANVGRKQATVERGVNVGEARYRQSFTKRQKRWVIKPIMEKKSYAFLNEMQTMVLTRCKDNRAAAEAISVNLPQNIASEPVPSKEELIRKHRSRFDRS